MSKVVWGRLKVFVFMLKCGVERNLYLCNISDTRNFDELKFWFNQISPDGMVFQFECANKTMMNSGTAVGIRGKDGVDVNKIVISKLYEKVINEDNEIFINTDFIR